MLTKVSSWLSSLVLLYPRPSAIMALRCLRFMSTWIFNDWRLLPMNQKVCFLQSSMIENPYENIINNHPGSILRHIKMKFFVFWVAHSSTGVEDHSSSQTGSICEHFVSYDHRRLPIVCNQVCDIWEPGFKATISTVLLSIVTKLTKKRKWV